MGVKIRDAKSTTSSSKGLGDTMDLGDLPENKTLLQSRLHHLVVLRWSFASIHDLELFLRIIEVLDSAIE